MSEPGADAPIHTPAAADWHGNNTTTADPDHHRDLGLRVASPVSANVSRSSSVTSAAHSKAGTPTSDNDSLQGVRSSGPAGEKLDDAEDSEGVEAVTHGISSVSTGDLPGGKPEDELKDAKDHTVGHMGLSSVVKKVLEGT